MRTLYFSLVLTSLCAGLPLRAQNSSDCLGAIPICGEFTQGVTFGNDGQGDIADFDGLTEVGCLEKGSVASSNVEGNASWFVFRVLNDGQIGFDIQRLSATSELDFALFGPDPAPETSDFCADIGAGNAEPIRCNYERNSTDFTGIGVNPDNGDIGAPNVVGSDNTYDEYLDVQAGEVYYLFVNNFNTNPNPDPEPFSISFTENPAQAGESSVVDCDFGFELVSDPPPPYCEGDQITINLVANDFILPYIDQINWSVDEDDDGTVDRTLNGFFNQTTITVDYPDEGRYRASVQVNIAGQVEVFSEGIDLLVEYNGVPDEGEIGVTILDDFSTEIGSNREVYSFQVNMPADAPSTYEFGLIPASELGNPTYEIDYQSDRTFVDVPAGVYYVRIRDVTGCEELTLGTPLFIAGFPRFFSPNGDGINETWDLRGLNTTSQDWRYAIAIFDRYGQLMHIIDYPDNPIPWNGRRNIDGAVMPASDYWFRVVYIRPDGVQEEPITVRSHFSLIREIQPQQ